MQNPPDNPAPSPIAPPDQRVMNIGGPNFLVNGRRGGFIANHNDFYLGYALIHYGEYGELEWHLLQQLVRPDTIVLEVGANIGSNTIPFSKLVGDRGRVIAIEPQRVIFQYLCGNVALNGLANVETYHCGCGERTGIMSVPLMDYFSNQRSNFGSVSLLEEGAGEPVSIRTVDDIVGARNVQLIKIDVEGMEAEVLRAAKRTIKRSRPFMYVKNDRIEKSEELIKLLQHYQYRLFWHSTALYNPLNFFDNTNNVYGGTRSINMFCVPAEATMDMRHFREVENPREHPLHAQFKT